MRASIVALRTVEVLFATGIPSKVYCQILVSFFKNGIVFWCPTKPNLSCVKYF